MSDLIDLAWSRHPVLKQARPTNPAFHSKYHPSESIMALLARSRRDGTHIPASILSRVAMYAHHAKFHTVLRHIVEHVIRSFKEMGNIHDPPDESAELVNTLLITCSPEYHNCGDLIVPLLYVKAGLSPSSYETRTEEAMVEALPPAVLSATAAAVLKESNIQQFEPLLQVLFRTLLAQVPPPDGTMPVKTLPGTWTLYRIVLELVDRGSRSLSFELFGDLVRSNRIPAVALNSTSQLTPRKETKTDDSQDTFDAVIILTIARACEAYNWPVRMTALTKAVVSRCTSASSQELRNSISDHVHEIIENLTRNKIPASLKGAVTICKACALNDNIRPLPDSLIQNLYYSLEDRGLRSEMARLYLSLLKTSKGRQGSTPTPLNPTTAQLPDIDLPVLEWGTVPQYYPPNHRARIGLMEHFVTERHDVNALRILVQDIVSRHDDRNTNISFLAEGVALLAEAGQLDAAKEVWARTSNVPGFELLYGNAKAVMRMCKGLVAAAIKAKDEDVSVERKRPLENTIRTDQDGLTMFHSMGKNRTVKAIKANSSFGSAFDTAKSIIQNFILLKQPLANASHRDLTTITRLGFLIDDLPMATISSEILLDRKEIPDLYDLNVLLSGIAQYDCGQAVSIANKAIKQGIRIDKVAWATLIHYALINGDFDLSRSIIKTAHSEHVRWGNHVIDIIVRRGFDSKTVDRSYVGEFLAQSFQLLQYATRAGHAPWMSLGVLCIHRAVQFDFPLLAFKFWKLVCKPKLATSHRVRPTSTTGDTPDDRELPHLQRLIAESLSSVYQRNGVQSGFTYEMGDAMCMEMGVPDAWAPHTH